MCIKKIKGFTLLELIVVIAIIGILAAILVPLMLSYTKTAEVGRFNANAKSVFSGAQLALTDLHAANNGFKAEPGEIYLGSSDCVGHPVGSSDDCSIEDYMGDNFKGYFGFMLDDGGVGCSFAVWSDRPVTAADMAAQMSLDDVKDNFKNGNRIGCSPLLG